MQLNLTSEQSLLRDSAAKFVAATGPKVAREHRGASPSFSPARLRQAAELGWLGVLVPSAANGLGLGLTELALVLEQTGRGLICEPVGLAAIAAAALARAPTPHPVLACVVSGAALVVPALEERGFRDDPLAPPLTRVTGSDGVLRLSGAKVFVCADGADGFIVSASAPDGPMLCYVARNAQGCEITPTPTVEGRALATLGLADTPAERITATQASSDAVDAFYNLSLFALSAELLGVMEKAYEITLDYLRIRKQFGKPIGSFQALQHQAVNAYVHIEATRSLLYQIAANNDPQHIDPAMAAALKAKASEDALIVTKACIQLHGGIGFTDEHEIGLYLKRAMLLSSLCGNAAAQRRRYAAITKLSA